MPNIDILVLAILQGATEFLPIGSSGHLIMVPQLYCWGPQAPGMELAVVQFRVPPHEQAIQFRGIC